MVDWALSAAKNAVDGVVLVVPPSDANLSVGDANRLRDDTRGADFVVVGERLARLLYVRVSAWFLRTRR